MSLVLGASFVLALTFLAWGGLIRLLVRRARAVAARGAACTAVLQEMSQTVVMGTTGMPWPCRTLAFAAWPSFVGAASVLGAYGLSFLAALVSAWAAGLPSLRLADGFRVDRARRLIGTGVARRRARRPRGPAGRGARRRGGRADRLRGGRAHEAARARPGERAPEPQERAHGDAAAPRRSSRATCA